MVLYKWHILNTWTRPSHPYKNIFLTGGNHTHGWATTFRSLGEKFSGLGYS